MAGAKDLALRHYIRAVRYAKCFTHVVIGNEYPNTTISQVEYYILNIIYCFWIDSREGLVEQGNTQGGRLTLSVRDGKVTADDPRGPLSPGRVRSTHKIRKP